MANVSDTGDGSDVRNYQVRSPTSWMQGCRGSLRTRPQRKLCFRKRAEPEPLCHCSLRPAETSRSRLEHLGRAFVMVHFFVFRNHTTYTLKTYIYQHCKIILTGNEPQQTGMPANGRRDLEKKISFSSSSWKKMPTVASLKFGNFRTLR